MAGDGLLGGCAEAKAKEKEKASVRVRVCRLLLILVRRLTVFYTVKHGPCAAAVFLHSAVRARVKEVCTRVPTREPTDRRRHGGGARVGWPAHYVAYMYFVSQVDFACSSSIHRN